jgi:hypothetical protein
MCAVETPGISTAHIIAAFPVIPVIATPALPAMVSIPPPSASIPSISAMVRHEPFTFMLTVIPELMIISSVAVGTGCPPQVAGSFQFPLTLATRVAPRATFQDVSSRIKTAVTRLTLNCTEFFNAAPG